MLEGRAFGREGEPGSLPMDESMSGEMNALILICWGYHHKILQTGWFKTQEFILQL